MSKRKKKNKRFYRKRGRRKIPERVKSIIIGAISTFFALFFLLSFFRLAGVAGTWIFKIFSGLIGQTIFVLPLMFFLFAFFCFTSRPKNGYLVALASLLLVLALCGILSSFELNSAESLRFEFSEKGGWLGTVVSWPILKIFSFWVGEIIFIVLGLMAALILWHFLYTPSKKKEKKEKEKKLVSEKKIAIKKVFAPRFKIRKIEEVAPSPALTKEKKERRPLIELESKKVEKVESLAGAQMPPLDLLEGDKGQAVAGDVQGNSQIIKRTLENFSIFIEMSGVNVGPTVSQYTLKPAEGVKLSKITALNSNLALALAAHPIRIEAPIPGKSLVGIEVPNQKRALVRLRDLLADERFQKIDSLLAFAVGRDVVGEAIIADLARMPHLLVAGSTGTGKTIGLNSIILSLLYKNTPKTLRLVLIDPKRVEFTAYNHLPHLLTPVIYDASKTVNALRWLIEEMEGRFELLSAVGARNITSYNRKFKDNSNLKKEGLEYMPFIILIIDELADLMAARGRDVEAGIVRLAQKARAVGIHLILATQRPSVEVITGLIKANIIARLAFQVASQIDSRTILDMAGAEKLLGDGDMLFVSSSISKPRRIQGAYVSEKEILRVAEFIVKNQKIEGIDTLSQALEEALEKQVTEEPGRAMFGGQEDLLYEEAKNLIIETKTASASFLQRRLRIGYARAARLLDILEGRGVVGPSRGAKPREVFGDTGGTGSKESIEEPEPKQDPEKDYNEEFD